MPLTFPLAGIVRRLVKGSRLTREEGDGNLDALEGAIQTTYNEAIKTTDATPLTALPLPVVGSDQLVVFRAGVGYLAPATSFGIANSAPGAFTAPQWTVAPIAGGLRFDITALPSDGGSAITALQYRLSSGDSPVSFTGTGTGTRDITGLAATSRDTQIRAVNAVGAGPWSDVKTETPGAAAGGGPLTLARAPTINETYGGPATITIPAVGVGNSLVIVTTQDKPIVRVNGSINADASALERGLYTHFFHIDNVTDGRTSMTLNPFTAGDVPTDANFAWAVYEISATGLVVASSVASNNSPTNTTAISVGFTTTAADAAGFLGVNLSNSITQTDAGGWTALPGTSSFNPFGHNMNLGAIGAKTAQMTLTDGRQWGAAVLAYRRA